MTNAKAIALLGVTIGIGVAGHAQATCPLPPTTQIGALPGPTMIGTQTWTPDHVYSLVGQVYLTPGATLTIEAGTIIASDPANEGSLAIPRGAQIFINGTEDNPVIMTSTVDVATWTDCDPKTGEWHEGANEWGNLTIMGNAYISNGVGAPGYIAGNVSSCGDNVANMEGLTNGPATDRYGGTDDEDDSGSISHLSIRYGGKVVALQNELNGLSLGGLGRGTDIDHVEVMNNIDDGVEIWGGTVQLKYISLWNVGDDSFDCDQGWRGKAQFILIVQGYSINAPQGSGVGDNCFETDGAENSDAQPVTTAAIYNATVIGQPAANAGDGGTAWRDGARIQYRNCIFMDLGEKLIRFDNIDTDGGLGYGAPDSAFGTLSFAEVWQHPWTEHSAINACTNPEDRYQSQSAGNAAIGQGFLCEITDSVFFRNLNGAYTGIGGASTPGGADDVGVTVAGGSNPAKGNVVSAFVGDDTNMPITAIMRGPAVTRGGTTQVPVISLDPRAANDAVASISTAPADGFFTPAAYRGAFPPPSGAADGSSDEFWLRGWSASDAYGFVARPPCPADFDDTETVGFSDLLVLLAAWGPCPGCPEDLDGNGDVAFADLLLFLASWGPCP